MPRFGEKRGRDQSTSSNRQRGSRGRADLVASATIQTRQGVTQRRVPPWFHLTVARRSARPFRTTTGGCRVVAGRGGVPRMWTVLLGCSLTRLRSPWRKSIEEWTIIAGRLQGLVPDLRRCQTRPHHRNCTETAPGRGLPGAVTGENQGVVARRPPTPHHRQDCCTPNRPHPQRPITESARRRSRRGDEGDGCLGRGVGVGRAERAVVEDSVMVWAGAARVSRVWWRGSATLRLLHIYIPIWGKREVSSMWYP